MKFGVSKMIKRLSKLTQLHFTNAFFSEEVMIEWNAFCFTKNVTKILAF